MIRAGQIPIWEISGGEGTRGHQTQGKNKKNLYTLNSYSVYMAIIPQ